MILTDAALDRLSKLEQSTEGFPPALSVKGTEAEIRITFGVSADLCWFSGHFPGYPVLPGVVQLHWAVVVCREVYGFADPPGEIKRLKFKKLVTPPCELELLLSRPGPCEAQFRFLCAGDENSEGCLVFPGTG